MLRKLVRVPLQLAVKVDGWITAGLNWATSTKGAFYALVIVIVVANVIHPPADLQAWLLVAVSEFYQGVALPGLGAAQAKEAQQTRQLITATHDESMAAHKDSHEALQEVRKLLQDVHQIAKALHVNLVEGESDHE